ncbi:type VI immunity family protein [Cystobacter fuscus]
MVARDGVILCFFMRRSHKEVAPAVWRALQNYLRAIPPQSLNWYGSDDGDMVPLDDKGWEVIRKQILERPWGMEWLVDLSEDPGEAGGYHFNYDGRKLEDPIFTRDEGATSAVSFTFPTEYLLEHGPTHLRALALELARELPLSFGYASLAFVGHQGSWYASRREVSDLLERYPGLDLYHLGDTSRIIGTRARGAYWLTFLGQPLLGELGGIERLRHELSLPGVSFHPLEDERLLLSLGEWPDAIDTTKEHHLPQYLALAHLLEPFLYEQHTNRFSVDRDIMRHWVRHLSRIVGGT